MLVSRRHTVRAFHGLARQCIRTIHESSSPTSSSPHVIATQQLGHREYAFHSPTTTPGRRPTLELVPSSKPSLVESIRNIPLLLEDLFLPRDHATSTTPDYLPYVKYQFIASVAGTTCGVLSMQSLLFAIGLQSGAIPMAAALNWVIKDGLGQFGGVLFASLVNHRFDADPKRWRMVSAFAMDAATLLEILTPLWPAYFLPLAAAANMAKNISWLSSSATRAGFHYSFAQKENLADITAKAGSQSIASSIVGTAVGIAISPWLGTDTFDVAAAFGLLSAVHLCSIYKSLAVVALPTLNQQRLHAVADAYWQHIDATTKTNHAMFKTSGTPETNAFKTSDTPETNTFKTSGTPETNAFKTSDTPETNAFKTSGTPPILRPDQVKESFVFRVWGGYPKETVARYRLYHHK
ncbi:hypothetical protein DYB28_004499 [Aphanomyces astaci]|uniref:Protein root UVB sensitive/RUS domain-containing protein n=1 Tax=Aphanomyces astaci TaxID=112090 RepID=A0A9X8DSC0_APHAT|nr:hypothetical protein DYB28_004499 [Aphanomyces astaci]